MQTAYDTFQNFSICVKLLVYENIYTFFGFYISNFGGGVFGAGDICDPTRRGGAGSCARRHQHFYQARGQVDCFATNCFDAGDFLVGHKRRIYFARGLASAQLLCCRILDGVLVLHCPVAHQRFLSSFCATELIVPLPILP